MNWEDYLNKLNNLRIMDQNRQYFEDQSQVGFPPNDEVGFKHQVITPADEGELVTKNMRTANLDTWEHYVVRKAGIFITYLDSFRESFRLKNDENLDELEEEVIRDVNIILNVSVAKKGWLTDNILNPRKHFNLFGDRIEKRGLLPWNRGGNQNG